MPSDSLIANVVSVTAMIRLSKLPPLLAPREAGQEFFDEFALSLVLSDLLNARLSARGDRQAPEIVELNDASRGEGLQMFLGDALIAERSVDDGSGRAVGEADENRNGVGVVAGDDRLGLDRKASTKERQGVHEMTDFADDASTAFVALIQLSPGIAPALIR